MGVFDEREKAAETKFFRDEDLEFHILMRRDKLFGLWAAQQGGLSGDAALEFARTLLDAEIDRQSVVQKVSRFLAAYGQTASEADLKAKLMDFHEIAREQVYIEQM